MVANLNIFKNYFKKIMLCSNRQKKICQASRSNVYSQYYIKKITLWAL